MTGKRKFMLTILSMIIVLVVMCLTLSAYKTANTAPNTEVVVWFFITIGTLAGCFSGANAVEHYTRRHRQSKADSVLGNVKSTDKCGACGGALPRPDT